MTEKEFQKLVVGFLLDKGFLLHHCHDSRTCMGAGITDIIGVHKKTGYTIFVELKTNKGRVRPKQMDWLDALNRNPHNYVGIVRPDTYVKFKRRINREVGKPHEIF